MLTAEQIRHETGMDEANVAAALRFCVAFDCLDSDSYAEAKERILASMETISEELDAVGDDQDAQHEIVQRRYAGLRERA